MSPEQDGQPNQAAYEYILLHLTETKHPEHDKSPDEPFLTRSLLFTSKKPTINVGRSSKTISKKLLPAKENAYFNSPVVSREHAKITADLEKGALHVTDIGSMHGTAVNDCPVKPSAPTLIKSGDVIRFGVHVARGLDVFFPTECKVNIDMKPVKASYQAPDPIDLSDDESECSNSSSLYDSLPGLSISYGPGADADVTIGEAIGLPGVGNVALDGPDCREDRVEPNLSVKEIVEAAFTYEDSEGESESEDSDIDMEEEEEEEDKDEDEDVLSSVQEEEEDGTDDGAHFLLAELDNYNKHRGDLGNVTANKEPSVADESNPAEEDQYHDDAASADVDAHADNNPNAENVEEEVRQNGDAIVEDERPSTVQTPDRDTLVPAAAVINISSLLNPAPISSSLFEESNEATLAPANHTSTTAEKELELEPVPGPVPEALMTSVAAEIAAWSTQAAINEALPSDEIFATNPDAADSRSQGKTTSKKRKAEDMLAYVATADDAEKEATPQDAPPAVKRPATANAVSAAKTKHRGVVWAVAEKVGIAALGGAVVLGSLIYTAPSF